MRCSCQLCGEYMVHDERGLESRCICPNCFNTCSACMGTERGPATKEELIRMMDERKKGDSSQSEEYGTGI